jgi:protocatechuate 3,4-dioxygenase, beta subunit
MNDPIYRPERRLFLARTGALALGATGLFAPGAFAEELVRTPPQTEGPFYPDHLPLDKDNDLVILKKSLTPAVGEVTHLTGRILDSRGEPVRGAVVEIWQVDHNGVYIHSQCPNQEKRDTHFQGFGRFETGSTGEYRFRTIKPVPYPGRTPHIHFKVLKGGKELITTQCYVRGEALNSRDGVYQNIRDIKGRDACTIPFAKIPTSRAGELAAKFDIVLGFTPSA